MRLALAIVAVLGACRRPTYYGTVEPILARRCSACHGADGVPPPLGSYEQAARVAGQIALSVQRREMPPWGADDTGLCGSFGDSAWLEPKEIEALSAWSARGAPPGDPGKATRPTAPPFGPVARSLEVPPFSPRLGDGYRCFLLDRRLESDLLVTGLRVQGAVRQATLEALDSDSSVEAARKLDTGAGWPCFGGSGVPGARLVASWSWSSPALRLPEGSGIRLGRGRPVVLLLRYNLLAEGTVQARLELEGRPARQANYLPLRAEGFALPPGNNRTEVSARLPVERGLTLGGFVPRMQSLGREWKLTRKRGGAESCLGYFGHWNLYDQQLFRYRKPVELQPGDELTLTCRYSTTSRQSGVNAGEASEEEQCDAWLYVMP